MSLQPDTVVPAQAGMTKKKQEANGFKNCAMKQVGSKGLQGIPGVGKSIEVDLQRLGIERVEQLRHCDPQDIYERMMEQQGCHIDRCMLYVLRCAVYYAEGGREPDRLLWWNWKEEFSPQRTRRSRREKN